MSSSVRLLVPSLNPMRLRGVSWARLVLDVRPKPTWVQRSTAVPRRRGSGCGWRGSRPAGRPRTPARRGRRRCARDRARRLAKAGRSASGAGRLAASPYRSTPVAREQSRAETEGEREPRRRRDPTASPVSSGGAARSLLVSPTRRTLGHPLCRAGPVAQQRSSTSRRSSVVRSNAGEQEPVLGGRDDAGLVCTVEGDAAVVGPRSSPSLRPGRRGRPVRVPSRWPRARRRRRRSRGTAAADAGGSR